MTGFNSKRDAAADKLDNDDLTIAYMSGYHDGKRAAQPAQEPLTDDSILDIADYYLYNGGKNYGILEFARAIEAAHGIKENT